jgi:hypothetical protein
MIALASRPTKHSGSTFGLFGGFLAIASLSIAADLLSSMRIVGGCTRVSGANNYS